MRYYKAICEKDFDCNNTIIDSGKQIITDSFSFKSGEIVCIGSAFWSGGYGDYEDSDDIYIIVNGRKALIDKGESESHFSILEEIIDYNEILKFKGTDLDKTNENNFMFLTYRGYDDFDGVGRCDIKLFKDYKKAVNRVKEENEILKNSGEEVDWGYSLTGLEIN